MAWPLLALWMWAAATQPVDDADDALPRVDGQVRTHPTPPLHPGQTGALSLTITESPEPGSPLLVRLSASGVELVENRWDRAHVVDPQAEQPRLEGRLQVPEAVGRYPVTAWVTYVTCRGERCRLRHARVRWTIEVVEPLPSPAEPGSR